MIVTFEKIFSVYWLYNKGSWKKLMPNVNAIKIRLHGYSVVFWTENFVINKQPPLLA